MAIVKIMSLAWHQVPNASSGIAHVARAAGNQVNMAVKDRLSRRFSAVNADIEALYERIAFLRLLLQLLQKEMNGVEFRLPKIEVFGNVPLREDEHVAGRHRVLVSDYHAEFILEDDAFPGQFAEHASCLTVLIGLDHLAEVSVVTVPFHGIARIAECLKVARFITAALVAGNNMIDLQCLALS